MPHSEVYLRSLEMSGGEDQCRVRGSLIASWHLWKALCDCSLLVNQGTQPLSIMELIGRQFGFTFPTLAAFWKRASLLWRACLFLTAALSMEMGSLFAGMLWRECTHQREWGWSSRFFPVLKLDRLLIDIRWKVYSAKGRPHPVCLVSARPWACSASSGCLCTLPMFLYVQWRHSPWMGSFKCTAYSNYYCSVLVVMLEFPHSF